MPGSALTRNAQVLRYLLEVAPGAGHTILAKLAYLADLLARQHLGHPITGLDYIYDKHGPFDSGRFYSALSELERGGLVREVFGRHQEGGEHAFAFPGPGDRAPLLVERPRQLQPVRDAEEHREGLA